MSPYPLQDRRQHPRHAPLTATPPEAGNVYLPDPDPRTPMTTADAIALGALLVMSAATAVGLVMWVVGALAKLSQG